jgi:hypothetical protein
MTCVQSPIHICGGWMAAAWSDSAAAVRLPKNEPKSRRICGKKDTAGLPQRGTGI